MADQVKPEMHAQAKAAGCPDDLCHKLMGGEKVGGLGIAFWLALATQFGPVIWQIVQKIIDANQS